MKQPSRRGNASKVGRLNAKHGPVQNPENHFAQSHHDGVTESFSSHNGKSNGHLKKQEIKNKITSLVDQGRALGLSPAEIRAYMNPPVSKGAVSKHIPKFHIYKAHFWALYQRGLLWPALTSRLAYSPWRWRLCVQLPALLVILFLAYKYVVHVFSMISETECLIESGPVVDELVRPLFPCKTCANITAVPEVRNITREQFSLSLGYTGLPVLIKAAAMHWKALDNFSFEYFKNLYLNNTEALDANEERCQFFQYNTEFSTLKEALNMSTERAVFAKDQRPWYFGWSNCDSAIAEQLRQQYERPYFLPLDAESTPIDWIFMGGAGVGAGVHLDRVELPSWQAQVSGTKTWSLIPSPECSSVCSEMQVTVHKGDIIVVDTNAWYHSTFVHPGEISITIGSEYD